MSHFYGSVKGTKGEATRCGDKHRGYRAVAAGWGGAIEVSLEHRIQRGVIGVDMFAVHLIPWENSGGKSILLASGPLSTNLVAQGAVVQLHPELVRRYTEAEALRIMKEEG